MNNPIDTLRHSMQDAISELIGMRARLRNADTLAPHAVQATQDLRRLATSLMNQAVSLQQDQAHEARLARASMEIEG